MGLGLVLMTWGLLMYDWLMEFLFFCKPIFFASPCGLHNQLLKYILPGSAAGAATQHASFHHMSSYVIRLSSMFKFWSLLLKNSHISWFSHCFHPAIVFSMVCILVYMYHNFPSLCGFIYSVYSLLPPQFSSCRQCLFTSCSSRSIIFLINVYHVIVVFYCVYHCSSVVSSTFIIVPFVPWLFYF